MTSFAIVGASRGIGLGFVQKLSENPQNVIFALVRSPQSANDLQALASFNKNIHVSRLDLDDSQSIKLATEFVAQKTGGILDVLVNNAAAILSDKAELKVTEFPDFDAFEQDAVSMFRTNVVGVTSVANAFVPLLRKGQRKQLLFMSSAVGSSDQVWHMGYAHNVAYCVSKAALNMIATKFALALRDEGILVVSVSPGLVKTLQAPPDEVEEFYTKFVANIRKTSPQFRGALTVEQSVTEQLALLVRLTIEDTGKFLHSSGQDGNTVEIDPSHSL